MVTYFFTRAYYSTVVHAGTVMRDLCTLWFDSVEIKACHEIVLSAVAQSGLALE